MSHCVDLTKGDRVEVVAYKVGFNGQGNVFVKNVCSDKLVIEDDCDCVFVNDEQTAQNIIKALQYAIRDGWVK